MLSAILGEGWLVEVVGKLVASTLCYCLKIGTMVGTNSTASAEIDVLLIFPLFPPFLYSSSLAGQAGYYYINGPFLSRQQITINRTASSCSRSPTRLSSASYVPRYISNFLSR